MPTLTQNIIMRLIHNANILPTLYQFRHCDADQWLDCTETEYSMLKTDSRFEFRFLYAFGEIA